ncbi:Universal stress protein family [Mycobacterium tuberculosis]|nr:Universal stress protein family [Mycobacterium tuberculosis]
MGRRHRPRAAQGHRLDKIIVGTDGSEPSLLAVDRAAAEAGRRGALPHAVYVVAPWLFDVPDDPGAAQVRQRHDRPSSLPVTGIRVVEWEQQTWGE